MPPNDREKSDDYLSYCLRAFERFYGTDVDIYTRLEQDVANMYATYGDKGTALVMGLAPMCRDYNELRKLFVMAGKFIERFGIEKAAVITLYGRAQTSTFNLRKMEYIYMTMCRDIYSDIFAEEDLDELLELADDFDLCDEDFGALLDLRTGDDILADQEMDALMVQYPFVLTEKGILKNCVALLKAGVFGVARLYLRVGKAKACPPERMDELSANLIQHVKEGRANIAKFVLRQLLEIKGPLEPNEIDGSN